LNSEEEEVSEKKGPRQIFNFKGFGKNKIFKLFKFKFFSKKTLDKDSKVIMEENDLESTLTMLFRTTGMTQEKAVALVNELKSTQAVDEDGVSRAIVVFQE
jgi:hypothetical protein